MAKVTNQQFLSALTKTNNELRRFSEEILQTTEKALYEKPSPDRWNVIECFSHMNKSTELYLLQMENQLSRLKPESGPGYKRPPLPAYSPGG